MAEGHGKILTKERRKRHSARSGRQLGSGQGELNGSLGKAAGGERARDPGVMPSVLLFPGLFGVPGMPCDHICGCTWILVWKGSAFPARSIPEVFDPVPEPTPLTVPSLHTHALIMHSRHILTTKPGIQGDQDVCPYPHSPSVPIVCALCCGTEFTLTLHPAVPTTACRHPITHHPLSPELTAYLRGFPFPGRDFGAFLGWLCLGSCKAALQCVTVLSQHSFSGILGLSKAKTCGDVQ